MVVTSSIVVSLNQVGEEINDRLEDPEHKVQSSRKASTLRYDLTPQNLVPEGDASAHCAAGNSLTGYVSFKMLTMIWIPEWKSPLIPLSSCQGHD